MKVVFYHPNGQKYFDYLNQLPVNMEFRSFPYFRRFLGYHRGDTKTIPKRFSNKFPRAADVAIFGLAPFDINVFLIPVQKALFGSMIVYHTSYPDHTRGRLFTWFAAVFRFIINKYVDCIVCTPPILVDKLKLVYPDVHIEGMDHNIPNLVQKQSVKEVYDVGFIGEKSYKKGIDRFLNLARRYPDRRFVVIGSGNILEELPKNVTDLGYLSRSVTISYMENIRSVVLPSRKVTGWEELYSMVIVEAIKSGCYVFASNHIGPKFLFERHSNKMTLISDEDCSWQNLNLDFNEMPINSRDDFSHYNAENLNKKWLSIFNSKIS